MPPIQQRLQLIRSCLELGETELLALQVEKLSAEALDADLQALVAVLQAGVYRQALPQLVDYLGRSQALVVAVDAEREALMAEWRQLERLWVERLAAQEDCEQRLEAYQRAHQQHLGERLEALLELRYQLHYQQVQEQLERKAAAETAAQAHRAALQELKKQLLAALRQEPAIEPLAETDEDEEEKAEEAEATPSFATEEEALDAELAEHFRNHPDSLNDPEVADLWEATQEQERRCQAEEAEAQRLQDEWQANQQAQAFERSHQQQQEFKQESAQLAAQPEPPLLPEEEAQRLKKAYRRAARLCHPDLVTEDLKEQAHQLMAELNAAYHAQDLQQVERLLTHLQQGEAWTQEPQLTLDELKGQMAQLREQLRQISQDLEALQATETYQLACNPEAWSAHFERLGQNLDRQLQQLRDQLAERQAQAKQKAAEQAQRLEDELAQQLTTLRTAVRAATQASPREAAIQQLAQRLAGYRNASLPQPLTAHIERWISQFSEAAQTPMLIELAALFERFYFTQADTQAALQDYLQQQPPSFWAGTQLLSIQQQGQSQAELVQQLQALLQQQQLTTATTPETTQRWLYLDDILFSGNRIRQDLKRWLHESAPQAGEVILRVQAAYTSGIHYTLQQLNRYAAEAGKNFSFGFSVGLTLENRKAYRELADVLSPSHINPDPAFRAEIERHWQWTPRISGSPSSQQVFSSEANRQLLENELLTAGVKIHSFSHNPKPILRPLGFGSFELGFGALLFTERNCPNNTPLAFWWGDPNAPQDSPLSRWYPLLPRRVYQ